MKKVFAITILLTLPLAAARADQQRCTELVKECFAYSSPERDTCFKTVSSHAFCAGSKMADLAAKRARLSLVVPSNEDQGPAFLGPQLVSPDCISNFDNSWSSAMINGPVSNDTYASLSSSLEQCARVPASEVVRP